MSTAAAKYRQMTKVAKRTNKRSRNVTFDEIQFIHLLSLERKRADRSAEPFGLVLIKVSSLKKGKRNQNALLKKALASLAGTLRETDLVGWYHQGQVIGGILTEIGAAGFDSFKKTVEEKVSDDFKLQLGQDAEVLELTIHVYPEKFDLSKTITDIDSELYPELGSKRPKRLERMVKRLIDLVGSLALVVLLSPLLLLIGLAIRCTSSGPVLFRQARVGQFGREFTFLKFRSMIVDNDPAIHRDYVDRFIEAGKDGGNVNDLRQEGLFKIVSDPRVTPLGSLLRRTSLDELPQLLNVLSGKMSLVGPRPPIAYELEKYESWHRRRILEVKPGITGIWQVEGRSRTSFDDMVRMDLSYVRDWSLLLDLKILLRTPLAVFLGSGAH